MNYTLDSVNTYSIAQTLKEQIIERKWENHSEKCVQNRPKTYHMQTIPNHPPHPRMFVKTSTTPKHEYTILKKRTRPAKFKKVPG